MRREFPLTSDPEKVMFYLALVLIAAGLVFLFYVFVTSSVKKQEMESAPFVGKANSIEPVMPEVPATPEVPAAKSQPRTIPPVVPAPEPSSQSTIPSAPPVRIKSDANVLNDPTPRTSIQKEQIIVSGTLYFDHGRQIPLQAPRLKDIPASWFRDFKRAGSGTLTVSGTRFEIKYGKSTDVYTSEDLDQIVFFPRGLALVPAATQEAIPLFLTERAESVRGFIQKHARIQKL
jgi:hypothetical protein